MARASRNGKTADCKSRQSSPTDLPPSPVPRELLPMPGLKAGSSSKREEDGGGGSFRRRLTASSGGALKDKYKVQKELGKGGFGVVSRAKCRSTGQVCAVKTLPLTVVVGNSTPEREARILSLVEHPYIASLYEIFRDERSLHLVIELCVGGSLARKIRTFWDNLDIVGGSDVKGSKGLPASLVGRYLWQMLAGIAYLHHHSLAHRDVKAENYMLSSTQDRSTLKLIDFGSACTFQRGIPITEKAGTTAYAAPEVFSGVYSEKCDVWSIGVVSYLASVGERPFRGSTEQETLKLVKQGTPTFDDEVWRHLPRALRILVEELLTREAADRPSAKRVIAGSEWLIAQGKRASSSPLECCTLS